MAEGFRIASGYVEVSTKLNKEQIRAAAQEAAAEFDTASAGRYERAGQHAGQDFAAGVLSTHETIERGLRDSGDRAGGGFSHRLGDRLRDEKGGFAAAGDRIGEDLGAGAERGLFRTLRDVGSRVGGRLSDAFSGAGQGLSSIADGFGKVASTAAGAGKWIGYVGLVGAGLEVVPPVIYAIGGALASIPALALGAGAALATLELGTQGIGAAIGEVFNPRAGGGGGGAAIDQMAAAERRLATAQRDEREAQQALSDARRQAVFDLQDLNLQLDRAHTNEKSAALAVLEARQELMRAQAGGDPLALRRAQIGLEQANESLAEAKQHTVELAEKKAEADAKGVEGSDRVVAANDRVTNSINAVKDAQDGMKQASVSAGGAAATAYSKLSPEAKKFVDEIARLKPELVGLQQYVQDRMFAGLDKKLDTWAHVWIPTLRRDLGMLGGDVNQFAKRLGDDLSKPEFIAAFDGVTASMDRVLTRFTTGGALDKTVTGFTALVKSATPFIESLANSALDKLGDWGDKLTKAGKDGSLDRFFKEAAKDAKDLWGIGQDVFDIVGKILDIASGQDTSRHQGKNALDRLKETLDDVNRWLDTDGGRQTIKDIIDGFEETADAIGKVAVATGKVIAAWDEFAHGGESLRNSLTSMWHDVVGQFLRGFKIILDGADIAFGWVPKMGPQLDKARKDFGKFVDDYNRDVNRMQSGKDFTITVSTVHNAQASGASGHGAQGKSGALKRWGGVQWAADGLVSLGNNDAGIYSGGPIFGFAEPETKRELFMPENGDPQRNKALATVAAQWAGLQVAQPGPVGATPLPAAASQAPAQHGPYYIQVGGQTIVALVIDAITGHPTVVSEAAQEGDRQRNFTNSGR